MSRLLEVGDEIDEVLSSKDLTDEQKIRISVCLLNSETTKLKEKIPEELFRRAFKNYDDPNKTLIKIRGHISLAFAYNPKDFSQVSIIRFFRHIDKFIHEDPKLNQP